MAPLVVSYGGGVDSLAVCIGLRDRGERPDAIVFADTKGENPETYEYLRTQLAPWLDANGFPSLVVVTRPMFGRSKTGDESLEDEMLRLQCVPSRAFGFSTCADKWKIDPFNWWFRWWASTRFPADAGWAAEPARVCIGFEYGEEHRVSGLSEVGQLKVYPLMDWKWDRDECKARILGEGLPIPPKSACWFCPSSKKTEILQLRRRHPDLMARALAMEDRANACVDDKGNKRWAVEGLGRRFSWRSLVEADEAQRSLFPEAPVEPCTKCNDGGCEVAP